MLSRGFDILQRAGGMEQISQLMVIVYGVLCVFGLLNCILGYRILRFWMMIFGFIIGAGAGFGVTYMSGVQDKMVIAGAMAGLGIVLAVVSFLIYRVNIRSYHEKQLQNSWFTSTTDGTMLGVKFRNIQRSHFFKLAKHRIHIYYLGCIKIFNIEAC